MRLDTCIRFKKTPPQSVVALPKATEFNKTVSVDLHEIQKRKLYYLCMIDQFYSTLVKFIWCPKANLCKATSVMNSLMVIFIKCVKSLILGQLQELYTVHGGMVYVKAMTSF